MLRQCQKVLAKAPSTHEACLSTSKPTVAVLATMDTKGNEARFVANVLANAGATPCIVDLSMKSYTVSCC